ncbi:MAG: PQQ-binding-like beta-propeller repeat protein [Deltaproteobacteria bacterium]|nr:PQQ-binding-like beta-propeller repeat protein [Deltaproteobacteria bacterium]
MRFEKPLARFAGAHRWFIPFALAAACGPRTVERPAAPLSDTSRAQGEHARPGADDSAHPDDRVALGSAALRWRTDTAGTASSGGWLTPQVLWSRGNLVVARDDQIGVLIGYDAADGHETWRLPMPGERGGAGSRAPVEQDGVLFLTRGDRLFAVDLAAGRLLWDRESPRGTGRASLAVPGRLVLLTDVPPSSEFGDSDSPAGPGVPAETILSAFDPADGTPAWEAHVLTEGPSLAVSPEYAVLVEHMPDSGEWEESSTIRAGRQRSTKAGTARPGNTAWPRRRTLKHAGGYQAEPAFRTVLSLYRLADGTLERSVTHRGYLERPLAWQDVLVITQRLDEGSGWFFERLTGFRLPSLEWIWDRDLEAGSPLASLWELGRIADDLLLGAGRTLQRIATTTGDVRAELDLVPLLPGGETDDVDWWARSCVEALVAAGDSLLLLTTDSCGNRFLIIDAATLQPRSATSGFDEPSPMPSPPLVADDRTAVLAVPGGLVAIDLQATVER